MIDAYPSQVDEPVVNNKCNHSTNLSTIDIHDALSTASKMHANVSMNANNMATKSAKMHNAQVGCQIAPQIYQNSCKIAHSSCKKA